VEYSLGKLDQQVCPWSVAGSTCHSGSIQLANTGTQPDKFGHTKFKSLNFQHLIWTTGKIDP
jgi:hypothetical protein